ncbi:MAG: AsmA family protein [Terriglobia bacterium]
MTRHPTMGRKGKLRRGFIIAGFAVLGLVTLLVILLATVSPLNRRWVLKALKEHYHSNVALKSFRVTLFPRITARGEGLVLSYPDRPGAPPLASIRRFSMNVSWLGLLRDPKRVRDVQLEGLTINVLPRHQKQEQPKKEHHLPPFYLENVQADGTVLNIFSSDPQKPPRVFAISKLRLRSVGVGKAMSFQTILTNPKPIGEIRSAGEFGPWNPGDPSETPVSGTYAFRDADLSTIHGIAGILASDGKYHGVLERINVDGETDTPDFALDISGHPEHLKTEFHAIVDGRTGQTLLQPVKAQLGRSSIIARGGALRTKGKKGTTIVLTVTTDHAHLADLLGLAVKSSRPPMTGLFNLTMRLDLPPGDERVTQRLKLNGKFGIRSVRFSDPNIQRKITHLSRRGEGEPGEASGTTVVSNLNGSFALSNGAIAFSRLSFDVPGASVNLHGAYGLTSEHMDFRGTLRLKAELSETTTGVKSVLLKAVDPLFKGKHAGTVIPIKITGDRQHPSFGIQIGKALLRKR